MTATSPNLVLLDSTRPDIANLVVAILQARDAVKHRSWSLTNANPISCNPALAGREPNAPREVIAQNC
jgi:hypothetical protein